jgi:hypothetical protein
MMATQMYATAFEWIESVVGELAEGKTFEQFCADVAKEFGVTLSAVGPASGWIYEHNGTRKVVYRSADSEALVKLICSDHGGGWDPDEAGDYIFPIVVGL